MSRTKKKPKTGAKAIAPSCNNHGSCPWCEGNRTYQSTKAKMAALAEAREFLDRQYKKTWEALGNDRSRVD